MNVLAQNLCEFINSSPSPYHVTNTIAEKLLSSGWKEINFAAEFPQNVGKFFLRNNGFIFAWQSPAKIDWDTAKFHILGGHTDSPNLRVKPKSSHDTSFGVSSLGVEPYGGMIFSSWLDRDLGISGRIITNTKREISLKPVTGWQFSQTKLENDLVEILFSTNQPIYHLPRLAIHLTKERNQEQINPQLNLNPISDEIGEETFLSLILQNLGGESLPVLDFEAMLHPLPGATLTGWKQQGISAPRLDNQLTCFVGSEAIKTATAADNIIPVLVLFNHEEVGSNSVPGAASSRLDNLLENLVYSLSGTRNNFLQMKKRSLMISSDMAHGTHPNYSEKHDADYQISLTGGPVLKINQNQRYASEASGTALVKKWFKELDLPLQEYVNRADVPCGTTIGPISAVATGIQTVDMGLPQLAMHAAVEYMSGENLGDYIKFLAYFLSGAASKASN